MIKVSAHPLTALLPPVLLFAASIAPMQAQKSASGKASAKIAGSPEALFAVRCSKCHGSTGQGSALFPRPLTGTRNLQALTAFIAEKMPPSGPKLDPGHAAAVARYVYDRFYSPIAQARNQPARVQLSRLTVKQFKNAVADCLSDSFPPAPSESGGLRGEYFKGRGFDSRLIARVDPEIRFFWGSNPPGNEGFDPYNFSAVWQGSILAPDTGEYEFTIRSDQAVRLWVNGSKQPLVDGWVRAKDDKEFTGAAYLVGGRAYPVRLEFSKATPGVDDAEKRQGKPVPPASITLLWRRPKLTLETIPGRYLLPAGRAPEFVCRTPFPPDDRSLGYEQGTSVSKGWQDAVTNAALEAAHYVSENLSRVTGVPDEAKDRPERLKSYCRGFLVRAFRRPITPEIERLYLDKQFQSTPDLETAVRRVVLMTLMSPRFLYRESGSDAFDVASHLSFTLWDTVPDPELIRLASSGELLKPEVQHRQAERLAADPRAWNKLRDFLLTWLKVEDTPEIVKNVDHYAGFDAQAAADLRTSLELTLKDAAWDKSSYRELTAGTTEFLNGRLAKVYGANLPPDAAFQAVTPDSPDRAGVVTHPYLLARFAYLDASSPIHRGVLLVRNMLGRTLNPPPAAFVPLAASTHPELTTRERVQLQTSPKACAGCHSMINPLGFALERFDAIGRTRTTENGKTVDSSGSYQTPKGAVVKFDGPKDLARYLAEGEEPQTAFVEKSFQFFVKQPVRAYGRTATTALRSKFQDKGYSIRELMVEISILSIPKSGETRK